MDFYVTPGHGFGGETTVPGDKSISHRGLIFGAVAQGVTRITGMLNGADCRATAKVLEQLGVSIEWQDTTVAVHGVGLHGLQPSQQILDFGNSGTSMRLFAGLLAAQSFPSRLTGDESLCRRPMTRIAAPLQLMGADIRTRNGTPPLEIGASRGLTGIDYELPVASAQVKSALLLAGLYAQGETRVREPAVTRDHSERMLERMGANIHSGEGQVRITASGPLMAAEFQVPGDFSSAAFPMVATLISRDGQLLLRNVGVNPTRTGLLTALEQMGARISIENHRNTGGEAVADIKVQASQLKGLDLDPTIAPLMIDEFPVLFAACAVADGVSRLKGLAELRTKESDRLSAMAAGLSALGVRCEPEADAITIHGGVPTGGVVDSFTDHRIAMALSLLAQRAGGEVTVRGVDNVETSFPSFAQTMQGLGLGIKEI